MSLQSFSIHVLNGVSFGSLLFFVASGLTLIFSIMRMVNISHGSLYLIGGLSGVTAINATGQFWLGLLVGMAVAGLLGGTAEFTLLRRVRGNVQRELLLTLGLSFIAADLAVQFWRGEPRHVQAPAIVSGSVDLGFTIYPKLRLFTVLLACLLGAVLYVIMTKTKVGAIVRAGVDDQEMIAALGVNVSRVFTSVFVAGSMLAGLAGVVGAAVLSIGPGADGEILLLSFAVVIIGGLGSLPGAALGSLVVGLIDAFGRALFPELASFTLFAPMLIILVARPGGLMGKVDA